MAFGPITSWQTDGETVDTMAAFILGGSTADGDCSHEIKRHLLLGRKVMTNLDGILKSRDITLPIKVHLVMAIGFSSGHVWMWELDYKESWVPKNWCFWIVVLKRTLESPLDCKEIQPVHPEGDQSWVFIGQTDAEAETPILWPPDAKSWLIGKDPDAGRDWGQEEKGMTEDEMAGWHHRLDEHGFGWTPGVGDGQGGLAWWDSWGHKQFDTTEWLNWPTDACSHSFLDCFPVQAITERWAVLPLRCSRSCELPTLYTAVCICHPNLPICPCPYLSPWQPYICFLHLWLYFCFISKFNCIVILDSTYTQQDFNQHHGERSVATQ